MYTFWMGNHRVQCQSFCSSEVTRKIKGPGSVSQYPIAGDTNVYSLGIGSMMSCCYRSTL